MTQPAAPALDDRPSAPTGVCPVRPGDQVAAVCPAGADPTRAFSVSMVISGIRCVLTYVVFPWVLPALGYVGGIGPGLGLAVGVVAISSNVASIRRFMRSRHKWRWHVAVVNVSVIGLLGYLLVIDLAQLLG